MTHTDVRIGVDLGGTKIEAIALARDGTIHARQRIATPAGYDPTVRAVADLIAHIEAQSGAQGSVGVGIPGVISPATGLVKNANTQALNGRPFDADLAAALGRPVRVENDANCFALSEASDGAGSGAAIVFGVILGTGCGGGIVIDGRVRRGRQALAGEWGHTPLPWAEGGEHPGPACWCGKRGCMELWVAGPGLARDAGAADAAAVAARAEARDPDALAALARHADRLARGLAGVIDVLDPDVIVLGGGLSNLTHLYDALPPLLARHVFSDTVDTPVLRARHGDSSGVRGAAWLWPLAATP